MAAPSSTIDVSPSADASPLERRILRILSGVINGPPPLEGLANSAAAELAELYPIGQPAAVAEDFLRMLWSSLIHVVRRVPAADDLRQQQLVATLLSLQTRRYDVVELLGKRTHLWTKLPMLDQCIKDAWKSRPDSTHRAAAVDNVAVDEWASLNSFAARMFGADARSEASDCWADFALWELRSVLEEPPSEWADVRDTNLATACEWIAHAGSALHFRCSRDQQLYDMGQMLIRQGRPVQQTWPEFNSRRWSLWLDRFLVLGWGAGSSEVKERAQRTVKRMIELESPRF